MCPRWTEIPPFCSRRFPSVDPTLVIGMDDLALPPCAISTASKNLCPYVTVEPVGSAGISSSGESQAVNATMDKFWVNRRANYPSAMRACASASKRHVSLVRAS
jgi:hypothetical protein